MQNPIELWNLVNSDEVWVEPATRGGWLAWLRPTARARRLRERLPSLVRDLERRGVTEVVARRHSWRRDSEDEREVDELGIDAPRQSATNLPGSIYLSIHAPAERSGGFASASGTAVQVWISDYLSSPETADVRAKLGRSGCVGQHAFVWVPGFASAPFGVTEFLLRDLDGELPDAPPELPDEVTHVWMLSTWDAGSGVRWSPESGWLRFPRKP